VLGDRILLKCQHPLFLLSFSFLFLLVFNAFMIVFNVALKCYFLKGSEINLRVAKDKSQTMYLGHIRKLTQMSGLL